VGKKTPTPLVMMISWQDVTVLQLKVLFQLFQLDVPYMETQRTLRILLKKFRKNKEFSSA